MMNPNDRISSLLAKIRQHGIGGRISGTMRTLGVSGIVGGAVLGYPISQVMASGFDHFGRSWNQQSYYFVNFFSSVRPDVVILYSCDWATAGNIVTLYNQENAGDTNTRIEAGMQVSSVMFEGNNHEISSSVGATLIQTKYGMMVVYRSGFYTYISEQAQVENHHSETFKVNLIGADGISEVIDLQVDAYKVTKTANRMSDYGNQVSGPNLGVQGRDAYQTSIDSGAMIFGWTSDDILRGSHSSDVLFGWEGNDTIYGLDGDDFIMGEQGGNHIYGGRGADVFDFHSGKANNTIIFDTVYDFNTSEGDILSFSSVISNLEYVRISASEGENLAAQRFLKFKIEDGYLDVLVNSDGIGEDYFHIVRLMNHSGFNANEVSLIDLLRRSVIHLG